MRKTSSSLSPFRELIAMVKQLRMNADTRYESTFQDQCFGIRKCLFRVFCALPLRFILLNLILGMTLYGNYGIIEALIYLSKGSVVARFVSSGRNDFLIMK